MDPVQLTLLILACVLFLSLIGWCVFHFHKQDVARVHALPSTEFLASSSDPHLNLISNGDPQRPSTPDPSKASVQPASVQPMGDVAAKAVEPSKRGLLPSGSILRSQGQVAIRSVLPKAGNSSAARLTNPQITGAIADASAGKASSETKQPATLITSSAKS